MGLNHSITSSAAGKHGRWQLKAECFGGRQIDDEIEFGWLLDRHVKHPGLASIAGRSFFLSGQLLLGNLSKTVVVVGNTPHDRPSFLVCHLIGNRASFLCTEAPMLRVPDELAGWHGHYQEFIGAKKHLVLGLLSHTFPSQGSYVLARG